MWRLLKFGIWGVRAYHHTYFLGWRKFWALFHIWNASWLPKSIKCGRSSSSGWIIAVSFRCWLQIWEAVGTPELERVENLFIQQAQANSVAFKDFQTSRIFWRKDHLCGAQSCKLDSHVTTCKLWLLYNVVAFFQCCVGVTLWILRVWADSGTMLLYNFCRGPQLLFLLGDFC